jgi:DMSO/TMAO reductase YedYZ molybdopterin-dependent catalytic subunit
MKRKTLDRRRFLIGGLGLGGALALGGCSRLASTRTGQNALQAGEDASKFVQRLLLTPQTLAPEFPASAISASFYANGTTDPDADEYKALVANQFADYRLKISGLVATPFEISLPELRALPARTQITRHDCVEGWSAIGQWTGAPLHILLERAGLKPEARYVLFRCFDTMDDGSLGSDPPHYYETVDLVDAYHPQTILAYEMSGAPLGVPHGAPLRLRVERQLGYKMPKYLKSIEVVDSFAGVDGGKGGYWEDQGYDWYAGI